MAVDDVATALMLLADDDIREQFASADFGALGAHDLSADEESMVVEAARVEVEGFGAGRPALRAFDYVDDNREGLSPSVRTSYSSYLQDEYGSGGDTFAAL